MTLGLGPLSGSKKEAAKKQKVSALSQQYEAGIAKNIQSTILETKSNQKVEQSVGLQISLTSLMELLIKIT